METPPVLESSPHGDCPTGSLPPPPAPPTLPSTPHPWGALAGAVATQQPPPFFGKAPHFAKRGHVPLAPMGFTLSGVTPSPSQVFGSEGDEYLRQRTVVP